MIRDVKDLELKALQSELFEYFPKKNSLQTINSLELLGGLLDHMKLVFLSGELIVITLLYCNRWIASEVKKMYTRFRRT